MPFNPAASVRGPDADVDSDVEQRVGGAADELALRRRDAPEVQAADDASAGAAGLISLDKGKSADLCREDVRAEGFGEIARSSPMCRGVIRARPGVS